MADYKESPISGTRWQRCSRIVLENPLGGVPSANFVEDEIVKFGEEVMTRYFGELRVKVSDFDYTFPLRNPLTNELIEGATGKYSDIFTLLYSAYWDVAEKRDIKK